MDYFDYQTALSLWASFLAITFVALVVALDGKAVHQIKAWPDRVQASGWRWPLTVVLGIALAVSLWQVAEALVTIWTYNAP